MLLSGLLELLLAVGPEDWLLPGSAVFVVAEEGRKIGGVNDPPAIEDRLGLSALERLMKSSSYSRACRRG